MKKLEYTVQFVTPAFLGNAEQEAQWRTPPFKAMLRQWWRVLKAKEFNYNEKRLLEAENELFGSALGDKGQQSKIKIRLQPAIGTASPWSNISAKPINNPSLSDVYIGYGPIQTKSVNTAIPVEQKAKLVLILDKSVSELDIRQTVSLCQQFATLGSRSRNGWGSVEFGGENVQQDIVLPLSDWQSGFDLDWTHAIGRDNKGPLIWKTSPKETWEKLMRAFSTIRKEQVNQIVNSKQRPTISYPVTKNNQYDGNYRLPSQLLFKAHREDGKYIGYLTHTPHTLPDQKISKAELIKSWQAIHGALDNDKSLQRAIFKAEQS